RATRQPAARQRVGEWAVLAALLVAVLRLGPSWLPLPWDPSPARAEALPTDVYEWTAAPAPVAPAPPAPPAAPKSDAPCEPAAAARPVVVLDVRAGPGGVLLRAVVLVVAAAGAPVPGVHRRRRGGGAGRRPGRVRRLPRESRQIAGGPARGGRVGNFFGPVQES